MNKINDLYTKLLEDKGFTVNANLEHVSSGYAVAVESAETQVIETDLDLSTFGDLLSRYFDQIAENEHGTNDSQQCVGAWICNGVIFFDISEVVETIEEAIIVANESNQIAVFDLDSKQSIFIQ